MNIKKKVLKNLMNIPGWCTNRRIIVIESDDWGAIRMRSRNVYHKLLENGYAVDQHKYERNDSLASEEDLIKLFDVLNKYTDENRNHPIITANTIVANPDFEKIKASNYAQYFYEPFTDTLKRYENHSHSFDLWQEGIQTNIFKPQFHGREHINVKLWMKALQDSDPDVHDAFNYEMAGLFPKGEPKSGNKYLKAFQDNYDNLMPILTDGLSLFKKIFGYESKTFIAPGYTWNSEIEKILADHHIIGIQGLLYQHINAKEKKMHIIGSKNKFNQIYLARNCFFEPAISNISDPVNDCLYQIHCAFRWKKPAIISSHRVNFIGNITPSNRDNNLKEFDNLLYQILKRWPNVEFMSSDQLCKLIL